MTTKSKSPRKPFPKPPNAVPLAAHVTPTGPIQMMSKQEVMKAAKISSYVTLWTMIRRGEFPPARQLGPDGGRHSKIAWIDSEVYEALANKPQRVPKGGKAWKAS